MITVTLGIEVPPEKSQEAIEVIVSTLGRTRVEPGCQRCEVYWSVRNESLLVLAERWDTMEHLEHHIRSDGYRDVLAWIDMSDGPPEIHFDVVSKSAGLELIEKVRCKELLDDDLKRRCGQ
jgi:quinol monooxygenase YgiN